MVFDYQISYAVADSLSSRYHANASGALLVLLDVTPSQEMVDEGLAREVVNKIQKLRKKVCVCVCACVRARVHVCVCACVCVCLALHWLFSQTLSNSITHTPSYTPSYTYILHIQTHTHTHRLVYSQGIRWRYSTRSRKWAEKRAEFR